MGDVILDYSRAEAGVDVDLDTGQVSDDGDGDTDTITGLGNVTWLRASFFDDTIIGSANDERFSLYSGNDTLDAGGGFDTLDYLFPTEVVYSVTVDLQAGTATATGTFGGTTYNQTISGIERVLGSDTGNDVLRGANGKKDVLEGNGGDDNLKGGGGKDKLLGGNDKDTLDGGGGNDRLIGGTGNTMTLIGVDIDDLNKGDFIF